MPVEAKGSYTNLILGQVSIAQAYELRDVKHMHYKLFQYKETLAQLKLTY